MKQIISIAQVIVSILLIISILMQNRGSGLSGVFGGSNDVYRTRRGIEKNLFYATIVFVILFLGLSLANIFVNQ